MLDRGFESVVPRGPVNPKAALVLGAFFMTREIELSAALASHWTFEAGPLLTWLLPVSKTDPTAVGVRRQWGCVCNPERSAPCAVHTALKHKHYLERMFGDEHGALPLDFPLFPDMCGAVITKKAMVDTITALAVSTGAEALDGQGRNAFGGHSCRVSGARFLAGLGLEL